jgi:cell shape-determining protein MreD
MNDYSILHLLNIYTHVIAGSFALILGVISFFSKKGKKLHTNSGKLFLLGLIIVIITGLIGVFVFKRNSFLLIITVLSGYYGFSGYRTLKTKNNIPKLIDIILVIIAVISVFYFLYYFKSNGMYWSPVIIYSTIGALLMIVTYDLLRYLIPKKKYKSLWLFEHIFKMIGAFSALLSAFTGTVFYNYQPYSQFLPSVFGILLQIGFIFFYYTKLKRS